MSPESINTTRGGGDVQSLGDRNLASSTFTRLFPRGHVPNPGDWGWNPSRKKWSYWGKKTEGTVWVCQRSEETTIKSELQREEWKPLWTRLWNCPMDGITKARLQKNLAGKHRWVVEELSRDFSSHVRLGSPRSGKAEEYNKYPGETRRAMF